EDAVQIDRDDVFPILDHGLARTQHAVAPLNPGIVDEDRDLSDFFGDLLGHSDTVLAFSHIEDEALRFSAGVPDFPGCLRGRLLVHVSYHHLRALAGITVGDCASDAGA